MLPSSEYTYVYTRVKYTTELAENNLNFVLLFYTVRYFRNLWNRTRSTHATILLSTRKSFMIIAPVGWFKCQKSYAVGEPVSVYCPFPCNANDCAVSRKTETHYCRQFVSLNVPVFAKIKLCTETYNLPCTNVMFNICLICWWNESNKIKLLTFSLSYKKERRRHNYLSLDGVI